MQFGVFDHLDASNRPLGPFYEERLTLIEKYDRAGFYAYHLAEHHAAPIGMAPSPNVFLAAAAQRSRNLRLGALVYALPLYHPLRLAEEIGMLDQISGGRLDLGFGRGSSPIEIGFFQQNPASAECDYQRNFELVVQALETGVMRFPQADSPHDTVELTVRPVQRPAPPIWYGVHSTESAERAARLRLNIVSLDRLEEAARCIESYKDGWLRIHGSPCEARIGLSRFIVLARSDQAALAIARRAYSKWHASFTFLGARFGRPAAHPRPPDFDSLARRGQGFAGRPEVVAERLQEELERAGANYFAGQFAFGDMTFDEADESISLFADKVMPKLAC